MKTPEEFVKEYYQLPHSKIETVRIKSLIKCIERYKEYHDSEVIKLNIPAINILKRQYRKDLYEAIFARIRMKSWVYSHMKENDMLLYFDKIVSCQNIRRAIKILNQNSDPQGN